MITSCGSNPEPRRRVRRSEEPKPRARTVNDTATILGVGLTKTHELIASGKLRSVKIGRRRLVLDASIDELLSVASVEPQATYTPK